MRACVAEAPRRSAAVQQGQRESGRRLGGARVVEHGVGRGGDPHDPGGGSVVSCPRDHDIPAWEVDAQHRALGMERRPGGDVRAQDSVFLDWPDEELAAIIEARIDSSVDGGGAGGRSWNWIFTADEMRQRASSQRYIQKRCLGRPGDMMAFAIHASDVAIGNSHNVIEIDDIYGGERMYSRRIVDELIDELQNHVPDIDGAIGALKGLGKRTFTLAEWEAEAGRRGLAADVAAVTLESLFEASVVGVYSSGGQGGGSKTVYRYKDRFVQARESGQLQVHPGFTKELNLKDA